MLAPFSFFLTEKLLGSRDVWALPYPVLPQLWEVPHKPYWNLGVVHSTQVSCVVDDRVAFPLTESWCPSSGGLFSHEDKGGVAQPQGLSGADLVPKKNSLFSKPASYSCQITSPLMHPGCKMLAGLLTLAASFCLQAGVFFSIH